MEVYLTWQFWYQVLSAFAFGVASSLVPVLNSELFIVGALGSRLLGPLEVALGLALGPVSYTHLTLPTTPYV